MIRIGGRLGGVDLAVQHNLLSAANQLNESSMRLATLRRVNSGRDDPAGLIAAESLRNQMVALEAALDAGDRANAAVRVADSGMSQASELISTIRGNTLAAAGNMTSPAEREALQIEIDAAIDALDRIGHTTSIGGRNLLDGSAGYQLSGVNADQIANIEVFQRGSGDSTTIDIEVIEAAAAAQLTVESETGVLEDDVTLLITGDEGTTTLELAAGTTFDQIAEAVNGVTDATGVSAEVDGDDVTFSSTGTGSDATVNLSVVSGTFDVGDGTATGTDATVVVNGQEYTADGNTVHVRSGTLDADITLAEGFTGTADSVTVTGEGLTFLTGSDPSQTATLALPNVSSSALGGAAGSLNDLRSGGSASLMGDTSLALDILDQASHQLVFGRARAGAFSKFAIDSTRQVMQSGLENVTDALSMIVDTDVASESARMVQSQILLNSGIATAQLANSSRRLVGDVFSTIW